MMAAARSAGKTAVACEKGWHSRLLGYHRNEGVQLLLCVRLTHPSSKSTRWKVRLVACSKYQTDFSEMMAAGFISECISDLIEAEAAIDDGLNAGSLNCSNELRLMLAAAYYQALKPSLFGHQVCGRDLTGSAS